MLDFLTSALCRRNSHFRDSQSAHAHNKMPLLNERALCYIKMHVCELDDEDLDILLEEKKQKNCWISGRVRINFLISFCLVEYFCLVLYDDKHCFVFSFLFVHFLFIFEDLLYFIIIFLLVASIDEDKNNATVCECA